MALSSLFAQDKPQTFSIVLYHIASHHIVLYHIALHHIISYGIISHHIVSYCIVQFSMVSYGIVSYHIVSYHFISLKATRARDDGQTSPPNYHSKSCSLKQKSLNKCLAADFIAGNEPNSMRSLPTQHPRPPFPWFTAQ